MNEKKKNNLISMLVGIFIVVFAIGGGWVAIPLLLIALSIAIAGGVIYKNAKRGEESSDGGRRPFSGRGESSDQKAPSLQQQLLDYVALDDKQDGPSILRRKRADDDARAEALSHTGERSRFGGSGVSDGMLSKSEQQHLNSLSGDGHDELLHHAEALKDLLNAGIIEQAEYHDRLRELYQDARG